MAQPRKEVQKVISRVKYCQFLFWNKRLVTWIQKFFKQIILKIKNFQVHLFILFLRFSFLYLICMEKARIFVAIIYLPWDVFPQVYSSPFLTTPTCWGPAPTGRGWKERRLLFWIGWFAWAFCKIYQYLFVSMWFVKHVFFFQTINESCNLHSHEIM